MTIDARLQEIARAATSAPVRDGQRATLDDEDVAFHEPEVSRLRRALEQAGAASSAATDAGVTDATVNSPGLR